MSWHQKRGSIVALFNLIYSDSRWTLFFKQLKESTPNSKNEQLDFQDWAELNLSWLIYLVPAFYPAALIAITKPNNNLCTLLFLVGEHGFKWGEIEPIPVAALAKQEISVQWNKELENNLASIFPFPPQKAYKDGWLYRLCYYQNNSRAIIDFSNPDNPPMVVLERSFLTLVKQLVITQPVSSQPHSYFSLWSKSQNFTFP